MSKEKGKAIDKLYGKRRLEQRRKQAQEQAKANNELSPLDKLRKAKERLQRPLAKMKGWKSQRKIARLEKERRAG